MLNMVIYTSCQACLVSFADESLLFRVGLGWCQRFGWRFSRICTDVIDTSKWCFVSRFCVFYSSLWMICECVLHVVVYSPLYASPAVRARLSVVNTVGWFHHIFLSYLIQYKWLLSVSFAESQPSNSTRSRTKAMIWNFVTVLTKLQQVNNLSLPYNLRF